MDVNALLSSLITSNCTPSNELAKCTLQPQSVKMKPSADEQVSIYCVDKFAQTGSATPDTVRSEEITSPSNVTPSLLHQDDPISVFSNGSTDLSRYLASRSSLLLSFGDDENSSTATETISTVTETTSENKIVTENVDVKASSAPESHRKLIRSSSFTVETPSFNNLPSCDSASHATLNEPKNQISISVTQPTNKMAVVEDNRTPKLCCFTKNTSPKNSSDDSPVVSNQVAQRTIEILTNCGDDLRDFDTANIEEQVGRLKNMQLMLTEYHRLQLDHLKLRQKSEVETLQTQVECMEKILARLKSKHPAAARSKNVSLFNVSSNVSIQNRQKTPSKSQQPFSNSINLPSNGKFFFKNVEIPESLKRHLAAFVKGYLLRRLLKVDRVKRLMEKIKDVRYQLIKLSQEKNLNESDCQFGEMLVQQLKTCVEEFQSFIFGISTSERVKLIAADRENMEKSLCGVKFSISFGNSNAPPKKLSSATVRRLTSKSMSSFRSLKSPMRTKIIKNRRYTFVKSPRNSPSLTSSIASSQQSRNIFSLSKSRPFTHSVPKEGARNKPWR